MTQNRFLNFFCGWSDFFFTITEVILLKLGLYRLGPRVVEWHYADPTFRPDGKQLELARILERSGRVHEAEEHYLRALQPRQAFGYLFLGDFYERQQQFDWAIQTYETALPLASDHPQLANQLNKRLEALRQNKPIE